MVKQRLLYGAALALLGTSYLTLLLDRTTVHSLVSEDGFFEYLGAFAMLVAAIAFLVAFIRSSSAANRQSWALLPRLCLLGLAALFILAAGEEVSWGQRLFGFQTFEAVKTINRQEEFNLHNINLIDQFTQGPFFLFTLFWFVLTIAVPAVALFPPARRVLKKLVLILPLGLGFLGLTNYALSKTAEALGPEVFGLPRLLLADGRVEIQEANLAVIAAITGVYVYRVMLSRHSEEAVASYSRTAEDRP